jgi:hypothetical protein
MCPAVQISRIDSLAGDHDSPNRPRRGTKIALKIGRMALRCRKDRTGAIAFREVRVSGGGMVVVKLGREVNQLRRSRSVPAFRSR